MPTDCETRGSLTHQKGKDRPCRIISTCQFRLRSLEGARVASDTRKGPAALSRVETENAYRKRNARSG